MNFTTLGTVLGTIGGSLVRAPMIGAGIGSALGSSIDSNKAGKKANSLGSKIEPVDSNVTKFLGEINNQRLAYKTGSASTFYTDEVKKAGSSAVQGALQLSGGNTGGALAALSGISQGTSKGVNGILAELEKTNQFNTSLTAGLIKEISQRKLEISLAKYAQVNAEKAQAETNKNNIITALIGVGSDMAKGGGGFDLKETLEKWKQNREDSKLDLNTIQDDTGIGT